MSRCDRPRELVARHLAGEIAPAERAELDAHCAECAECRQLALLHGILLEAGAETPEPSEAEFQAMRERVLLDVRRPRPRRAWRRLLGDLGGVFGAHPVAAPAALAALLAVAVLAGRWSAAPAGLAGGQDLLLGEIEAQAAEDDGLASIWDSPYTFTNVAARRADDGRLALSFDVCRHVEVVTERTSSVARQVLTQAILDPSVMGTRLQAMAFAPEIGAPSLRDALVVTMLEDPSLAVRLKALEALSRLPFDAAARDAMMETLRRDPAVQMRLTALETLSGRQVPADAIRRAILEAGQESDPAVLEAVMDLAPGS